MVIYITIVVNIKTNEMKFTKEDYQSLKKAVSEAFAKHGITANGWIESANALKFSETRMLWDLFWLCGWSKDNRDNDYLDSHIQTAVKNALKELAAAKPREYTEREIRQEMAKAMVKADYVNEELSEYIDREMSDNEEFDNWALKATFPEIIARFIQIKFTLETV